MTHTTQALRPDGGGATVFPTATGDRQALEPEATRIVLYGDLTCAWSYLASRRAALLERAGVQVDWRMVEHERPTPGHGPSPAARLAVTRRDLDHVTRRLLPGEQLPHALAGFVPYTKPAVSGYAEAVLARVGTSVRQLLFDAFWMHGVDLGDARLVRMLLVDTVRSGHASSDLLRDWGYAVDVTGAPVTAAAWRLVRDWRSSWSAGGEIVPVLVDDHGRRRNGVDAVEWLGAELVRRGIDLEEPPAAPPAATPRHDLVDLGWASEHGNRWMQARREAFAPELFSRLRPWI